MTKIELNIILENHEKWLKGEDGARADLKGLDLAGLDLSGADLSYAHLRGADLRGANLSGAELSGADLRYANLRGADLISANLSGAELRNANLSYANLIGVNLNSADLSKAKTDKRYIQISCIGSRKEMTTYCFEDDFIWCGCFTGNLQKFEEKVLLNHKDNEQYLKEYMGFITYIKSLK